MKNSWRTDVLRTANFHRSAREIIKDKEARVCSSVAGKTVGEHFSSVFVFPCFSQILPANAGTRGGAHTHTPLGAAASTPGRFYWSLLYSLFPLACIHRSHRYTGQLLNFGGRARKRDREREREYVCVGVGLWVCMCMCGLTAADTDKTNHFSRHLNVPYYAEKQTNVFKQQCRTLGHVNKALCDITKSQNQQDLTGTPNTSSYVSVLPSGLGHHLLVLFKLAEGPKKYQL